MSRKPTIRISYPSASEKALQLTEVMVKRAPGKRVVETESEDPIFPDGGELFSGFIRCKTQTGVELTLTLNSASMDYALETLIRPNLTADERKRILGEDAEQKQAELKLETAAAELAESINHVIKPETNTEAEAAIAALLAYIFIRVHDKKYRGIVEYIEGMLMKWQHGGKCLLDFSAIGALYDRGLDISDQCGAPSDDPDDLLERLLRNDDTGKENAEDDKTCNNCDHYDPADGICDIDKAEKDFLTPACERFTPETDTTKEPSWDDVEAEARKIGQHKTDETNETDDIEPGLLNDIENGEEGGA